MFTALLIKLIGLVLAIVILVGVHEFGHFIVARWCGVKVIRFSIGFGRVLCSWRDKQDTEYAIASIPLGGYVKLLDNREGQVSPTEQHLTFDQKTVYQRFAILMAGPFMNIVFAIFAYWLIFSIGITQVKPVIGTVVVNSIADKANLKANDQIVAVNNHATISWTTVVMQLLQQYGVADTLKLTVHPVDASRQVRTVNLSLQGWQLDALRPNLIESLGIQPFKLNKVTENEQLQWSKNFLIQVQYAPWYAIWPAIKNVFNLIKFNWLVIKKVTTGVISWRNLSGPFSIFHSITLAANQGILIYLGFLASLSVGLAFINLLPFPGLDGGQLVYIVIEWISGRPVSVAVQVLAFRLGSIFLLLFLIQLLVNDLLRQWV